MPESMVAGIPVVFPFEPYEVQRAYMEKVIKCLRDGTNGVLESPTGTGKTLSLLCSSLAWLLHQKQEMQAQITKSTLSGIAPRNASDKQDKIDVKSRFRDKDAKWGAPKIIYASRTHSQLTQAMQELKRTAYSSMRAVVLGSRDQLCIHPEVMREQGNANKVQMCKAKVDTRTCSFHSRVESRKDDPSFRGPSIMDIEDLVKVGQKLKMCPYYAVKELVADADITFMPYNYLLDPIARKANKVELHNTIIILDEAHNIEKICEECASVQIKSSDVAMAIDDTTHIMAAIKASGSEVQDCEDESKDFTLDDLTLLKEMLLELEKAIDEIAVENKIEGVTLPASYIYDLLGKANLNYKTSKLVIALLEKLVQLRKGKSYQTLADMLNIVFINKEDKIEKIYKSFKVHIQLEVITHSQSQDSNKDVWLSKNSNANSEKKVAKIINYWCFNPGFGMEQLLNKNIRSIILTSGTLAPLKPLIAELALPVMQQLENPHIVSQSQVYMPKACERIVDSLVSEGCGPMNALDVVNSKYFLNSQNNVPGKRRFQTALNNAIQAEEINTIERWSLNDYAKATARPSDNKFPSVADFMSRLDGDVSTIDFNSKDVGTASNSQIQISKRRRSPTNSPSTSSTARNDTDGKKKYRLVDNMRPTSSLPSKSSGSPIISLDQFKFIDKPRLENDQNKKAPEERVEFLRVLRSSLSSDDFKAFSAALISYKTDNTIDGLMDILFQMLGKPCLFYMLQGMRRFLKNEHRMQFDKRLADHSTKILQTF
uniref:Helicase ATP-binding domain-containing protein n=1 Tax=Glossina morsitans morsitans TaxID=37546 RepID=A0A1B0F9W0_GLOMM